MQKGATYCWKLKCTLVHPLHWSLIASAPLSAPKISALRSSSTFTLYTTPQLKVYFSSESEFLEVIVKTFIFFRFSYHIKISLQPFCFFIQGNIWASRKRFLRLICCETSVLDIISGGGGFSKSQQCLISCLDLSNDGKYESPHWSEKNYWHYCHSGNFTAENFLIVEYEYISTYWQRLFDLLSKQ